MASKRRGRPPGSTNKKRTDSKKISEQPLKPKVSARLKDEIWAIVILALGAFLAISLQTEAAGQFGLALALLMQGSFGLVAYILPYYLIVYGFLLFVKRTTHITGRSTFFLLLIFICITILNSSRYLNGDMDLSFSMQMMRDTFDSGTKLTNGGLLGMLLGSLLIKIVGMTGLFIFCTLLILISVLLVINTPVSQFFDKWKEKRLATALTNEDKKAEIINDNIRKDAEDRDLSGALNIVGAQSGQYDRKGIISDKQMKIMDYMKDDQLFDKKETENSKFEDYKETLLENKNETLKTITKTVPITDVKVNLDNAASEFRLPPIDLLTKIKTDGQINESVNLKAKAATLETTLQNFGVNARVVQVTKGPAVTRYEIQPNVGVKVSSIVRLADDIALNLEAKSIRIEAPIPGKAAVGIEVENERVNLVTIREMCESTEYNNAKSKISFVVGKDISGNAIISNLKEMPHLLIAGSTGSGKSVCINSIIVSMLYKAKPDEVRFLLIDPKVVELNNYNGIPHLLIPVVTDPSKASAALNWAVQEMTGRYKRFAEVGVRDLETFNDKMRQDKSSPLPQIVIIIDELADLMMVAPAQVEESICRLAQMARAAGMHLIVATQRPSVDVITGVIKANIPSRIAFAVSSQFDSRTILDMAGAERLVGKGDMLFNPLGMSKPIRVQGAFISDTEVHNVINFLKEQVPNHDYSSEIINSIEKVKTDVTMDTSDELLKDAIETVVATEQTSVSMLQRRFRIGYNRAARLIDMMEERGIVSPPDGSRPRKVLISKDEFEELERLEKIEKGE